MFTDASYAPPVGSFRRPVPLITDEPGASPSISVSVACSWLPYIRGALQQLLLEATWATDDPAALLIQQQRVFNLIDLFQECSPLVLPFSCPFDFSSGGNGGVIQLGRGVYVSGSGWNESNVSAPPFTLRALDVLFTFSPAFVCSSIDMVYDFVKGAVLPPGFSNGIQTYLAGSPLATSLIDSSTDPDGTGKHRLLTFGSPTSVDQIECNLVSNYGTSAMLLGDGLVTNLLVDGFGAAPC